MNHSKSKRCTPVASSGRNLSRREFAVNTLGLTAGLGAVIWTGYPAHAAAFAGYDQYDAVGLAELIRNKKVKPEELLEAAIERVNALNPKLNAVVTPMYDEAKKAIGRGLPEGSFRGVPFLLKDIGTPYKGVRYTAGSQALANYIAPEDSELVKRYKQAGLVTFGKTNTPEFGLTVTTESVFLGAAANPWDTDYSTGGSSGGSAAAVAARIAPMAQGGDGGGSIRIPSSCCGVFGMKPSRGRMPMGPGAGEVWEGLVTYHALSLSVRDSAAILDATSGPEVGAPYGIRAPDRPFREEVTADPTRLRVGWTARGGSHTVHPDCIAAVKDAAELCGSLGHIVEEAGPDIDYRGLWSAFHVIVEVYTAVMLDGFVDLVGKVATPDSVEPWTWQLAERGAKATAVELAKTKAIFNRTTRALGNFFQEYDVLLTPTLGSPPKKLGYFDTVNLTYEELKQRHFEFCPCTWLHNVAGTPAMSMPLYWNKSGLPIGVQFATKLDGESTLYRLAGQLERARPWRQKVPQVVQERVLVR